MKKIVSCILLATLFVSMFTFAFNIKSVKSTQTPPAVEWSKTYGKTIDFTQRPNSVVQTSDGGFAIASTSDFGAGNDASQRFWLVKTDSTGNMEWNKTYGTQRSIVNSIISTSDGGYALSGNDGDTAWLVKTDANGIMQWSKTYPELGSAGGFSLKLTADGGYIMAGVKMPYRGLLFKTDSEGNLQWYKTFAEGNTSQLVSVIQLNDGGYLAVGAIQYPPNYGKVNAYVVKTDQYGNLTWSKEFSQTAGNDYGNSVTQTSDGGYAIAGIADQMANPEFLLIKTDTSGNLLWGRTYGQTCPPGAYSVLQTSDEGYALVGQTSRFGSNGNDLLLVKTDANGNMQWNEAFGGAKDDGVGSCMIQTRDGGYALSGLTNSFSDDGSYQVWLIKLAPEHRTWVVDANGSGDFTTIQAAINAANAGDTIFVRNGTYSGPIAIDKSLTLEGENKYTTVIDGGHPSVYIGANNVKISNFTIQHGIPDLYIGNRQPALTSNITIVDNIMDNSQEGVIRFVCSTANVLMNNSIDGTGAGGAVNFDWANDSIICDNTIVGGSLGAINGGYPSYNNTFSENTIVGGSNAIYMNNIFSDNKFFHNNFFNSGIHLTEGANIWDNGYPSGGNYWSGYTGVDSNGDGIGDSPYVIDGSNQDNYPLMNPWLPPDIAVTNVSVSKTQLVEGQDLSIKITVANQGNKIEAFNVTAFLNGHLVESFQNLLLKGGASIILNTTWGLTRGYYTVSVYIPPLADESHTSNNAYTGVTVLVAPFARFRPWSWMRPIPM